MAGTTTVPVTPNNKRQRSVFDTNYTLDQLLLNIEMEQKRRREEEVIMRKNYQDKVLLFLRHDDDPHNYKNKKSSNTVVIIPTIDEILFPEEQDQDQYGDEDENESFLLQSRPSKRHCTADFYPDIRYKALEYTNCYQLISVTSRRRSFLRPRITTNTSSSSSNSSNIPEILFLPM